MITAIGRVGAEFVKKLYTAKKFAGKKTGEAGNTKSRGNLQKTMLCICRASNNEALTSAPCITDLEMTNKGFIVCIIDSMTSAAALSTQDFSTYLKNSK